MHNFTRSTWTEDDSQRSRERFARMSNTDLKRNLEAAEYMFSPRAYRADSFLMLDVIFRSKDRNLQKWVHDLFALLLKTKGAA